MSTTIASQPGLRGWNISLWLVQLALLVIYLMAGGMKLTQPMEALAASGMNFVLALPTPFVRFVGLMEVLGAVGVVAPAATRILPFLTPWAAAGLSFVQVSAMILHVSRGEFFMLPVNLVLLALALFVLWGRGRKAPVTPR
jgi:putative oxidoreductase